MLQDPFPDVRCRVSQFSSVAPVQRRDRPAAVRHYVPASAGQCIQPGNRLPARVRLALVPVLHLPAHRVQELVPAAQRLGVQGSVTFRVG